MFNLFYQNSLFKKNLSVVLMITIIFSSGASVLFYPKPAQATLPTFDVPQIVNTVWEFVSDAMTWVSDNALTAYSGLSAAYDQWMKSESILAQAARIAAQLLLNEILTMLTNQIIEWIQGGGEPQFVSNWGDFLSDAADRAGGLFVERYLGAGYLCEPFDISVKIALLPVSTFETRIKCSISDIVANINDFANDFNQGSWRGWIESTNPQNNFPGGYFAAREEKLKEAAEAREAALQEAESSGGFLSVKDCVKGHTEDDDGNISDNCSNKDSCKSLKGSNPIDFYCDEEKVSTPGSVLSDITSETINQPLNLLREQIANLTSSMGIAGPFVTAIANALSNRIIEEGLAYIQPTGPTISNPYTPPPPGTTIPPIDQTPAQTVQDKDNVQILIAQQKLLKENLENQLLSQQQSNLGVLQNIETIQNNTLSTLVDILEEGCSLPSWATSVIQGDIITINATGVGSIVTKKVTTITNNGDSGTDTVYSYQTQQISPQITSERIGLEADIAETNQWITDTASAVASGNGYLQTAEEYLTLYRNTLQPPTTAEQALLDGKKVLLNAAKDLVLSDGRKAVKTTENQNLIVLNTSTQNISIGVIQKTSDLLAKLGYSEEFIQAGTLYAQRQSAQSALSQAQSNLSSCSSDSDGE